MEKTITGKSGKVDLKASPDDIPRKGKRARSGTEPNDASAHDRLAEYINYRSKTAEICSSFNEMRSKIQVEFSKTVDLDRFSPEEVKAKIDQELPLKAFTVAVVSCEMTAHWKAAYWNKCSEIVKVVKELDVWKERYEREVLTGKKFLESKAGQAYVSSVKEEIVLDCRRLLRESGRFPKEDFMMLHPEVPDVPTAMELK